MSADSALIRKEQWYLDIKQFHIYSLIKTFIESLLI